VIFTLSQATEIYQMRGFAEDAKLVEQDLNSLKNIMEEE
jgi:hypothetical protein